MNSRQILISCGITAPVIRQLAIWGIGSVRPDYSQARQIVSELGAQGAPYATLFNLTGLILAGCLTIPYTISLYKSYPSSRSTQKEAGLLIINIPRSSFENKTPLPEVLLPMTPAVFNILLALADGEKHRNAIMQEVEANPGCIVTMGPGTLYGSIKGMLAAGLNEESVECPDLKLDDQRHRYYRLTSLADADIIGTPAEFAMPNILI